MLCVYKGRVCVLKFSVFARRWVYIKESCWRAMSQMEREAYADSEYEARMMEGEEE